MSNTIIVRYQTHPDAADENQRLIEEVFAELRADKPDSLRYAAFRLAGDAGFVHIAVTEGEDNPLLSTPAFTRFTATIAERLADQPVQQEATLIDSYRFLET